MNESQKQLSALSLIAVIIGSTIGSGIFAAYALVVLVLFNFCFKKKWARSACPNQ